MSSERTRHLTVSALLLLFIVAIGTAGYMALEGWDLFDALYMTVITISTVGFHEVHQVSYAGRVFTMLLVFGGVGFSLYVAAAIVQIMVEGQIRTILGRRRLDNKIKRLKNHYIICGYGRIGRVLYNDLRKSGLDLVVIENNPETIPALDADGVLYLSGDASDEGLLIKARIDRAKCLVAALATDIDNVFLVLTARQLSPDLIIIARASHDNAKAKLKAAGADRVESPYDMGAASMAQRILRPAVTNFLDLALAYEQNEIQMEEIPVNPSSDLVDVMLKDSGIRQEYNLILIAIRKADGRMEFNPSFETIIGAGDTVVAVGEEEGLRKMEKVLNPETV
ncbi:MAG: potassium channel protein [Desulfobacterales bacterium]